MRKLILFAIIFFTFLSCSKDDIPIPIPKKIYEGDVVLKTQLEVNEFGDQGFTHVIGTLIISDSSNSISPIVNLNSLNSLNYVEWIFIYNNNMLTNLDGLNNLDSVRAQLIISGNPSLTSIEGLNNLSSIGAILQIDRNSMLPNFNGLNKLSNLGEGSGHLRIWGNRELTNIDGIKNISNGGWIYIYNNYSLTNLDGLNNVSRALYLYLANNPVLTNLDGLSNLYEIAYDLDIYGNASLTDYCGLQTLFNGNGLLIGDYIFENNGYNPSMQDILEGRCFQ